MPMRRARRGDQGAEDAQTVARVRAELTAFLAEGGPDAAVRVAFVLDLLLPPGRGMWSFDPERRAAMERRPDPDADPLTGARWAGPPGTHPAA